MTLARLCAALDAEALSRLSVERIRRESREYRKIDRAEHLEAVRVQHRNQLDALARGRVVAGQALQEAAELARHRAGQGIDIEVLLDAYHLGDQVLWQALMEAADVETAPVLPRAASLLFASLHAYSTALTAAHAEASQALYARRITASQRLTELLLAGSLDAEARAHARALGLDADGDFVALAWSDGAGPATALPAGLLRALEDAGVVFAVGQFGAESLLVCQRTEPLSLQQIATTVLESGHGGVGLLRQGLAGAAMSLGDARLAAAVPRGGSGTDRCPARLEEVWPDACVLREADRLAALLGPVWEVAAGKPHLVAAVRAFARADMQIARAAQQLHLHPNSLSYRLDRWAALTGWHPRTFEGLRRSLLVVEGLPADEDRR